MTAGKSLERRSEKERRMTMANVELNSREAGLLKEVLLRYYSDIRFEIADTDDKEFLNFLKAREAFMRGLITRLEKAEMENRVTT
jgi:predicted solute-binding protein